MNNVTNIINPEFNSFNEVSQETNNPSKSRWEVKSQLCKRDRVIKGIALVALAFVGLALFGVSLGLTLGLSSLLFIPGIALGASAYMTFSMGFLLSDFSDYEDKETAKKTIEKIKTLNVENIEDMNPRALNKYGFTSDVNYEKILKFKGQYKKLSRMMRKEIWRLNPNEDQIKQTQDKIKELQNRWIHFRDRDFSQDLPNFG